MAVYKLSESEVDYLHHHYPSLAYDEGKNIIGGVLPFDLKHDENGLQIKDRYHVEIDFNQMIHGLPIVKETANRIFGIANKWGVRPIDLHLLRDNSTMCIIIPPKIMERYPNGFYLKEYLHHIQEHLYWVSYYDKLGKGPWKACGHGDLGYLELYEENRGKYGEDFKQVFECKNRPDFRRKLKELRKKYR